MDYNNYKSLNPTKNAAEKNWNISMQFVKSWSLVTVKLNNGKSYVYECPWKAKKGDIVVIGNKYSKGKGYEEASSTGQIGEVIALQSKSGGAKPIATIDYVFVDKYDKSQMTFCEEYLDRQGDGFDVLFYRDSKSAYPITFLIRKLVCAAAVLAHPEDCSPTSIEKARDIISQKQIMSEKTISLSKEESRGIPGTLCGFANLNLRSIQIDTDANNEIEMEGVAGSKNAIIMRGEAKGEVDRDEIRAYVGKYSMIGAIALMSRGSFLNLLEAFLGANPPVGEYKDEILRFVRTHTDAKVVTLLEKYFA